VMAATTTAREAVRVMGSNMAGIINAQRL